MLLRAIILVVTFFLSGCASVKILDVTATQSSSEHLTINVRTNKKIDIYENSFFANHVYLKYKPSNVVVKKVIDNPSKYEEFPFSIHDYEKQPCKGKGHCSVWKIPMKNDRDNFSIHGVNYTYELKSLDTITIKIGGGTIHGANLKSNSKVVTIE